MIAEAEIRRYAAQWGVDPMVVDLDYVAALYRTTKSADLLGERHCALSGLAANWIGTHRCAAERLINHLEWEAHCYALIR
jgi:hypothetical protein